MLNLVFFDYPFIHIDRFCITLSSFFIMLFFLLSNGAHWYFWEKKYPKKGLSILWSEAKIIWKPKLFLLLGEYMFCFFLYWLQTFTGNPKNTVSIITLAEDYLRYESLIYLLLLFFSLGTFSFHHGKERYLCMFDRVADVCFVISAACLQINRMVPVIWSIFSIIPLFVFSLSLRLWDSIAPSESMSILNIENIHSAGNSSVLTFSPQQTYGQLFESRQKAANQLKKLIVNTDSSAVSICISGEWGIGKTSLINGTIDLLKKSSANSYEIIRINALELDTPQSLKKYTFQQIQRILKSRGTYVGIGSDYQKFLTAATGVILDASLSNLVSAWLNSPQLDYRDEQTSLEYALSGALGPDGRLIIVVDDIERCKSSKALEYLFFIKEIASMRQCISIFLTDHQVLDKIAKDALPNVSSRQFLDKFFNYQIDVIGIQPEEVQPCYENKGPFWDGLSNSLQNPSKIYSIVIARLQQNIEAADLKRSAATPEVVEQRDKELNNCKQLLQQFKKLFSNPRYITRFYASLQLYKETLKKVYNDVNSADKERYFSIIKLDELLLYLVFIEVFFDVEGNILKEEGSLYFDQLSPQKLPLIAALGEDLLFKKSIIADKVSVNDYQQAMRHDFVTQFYQNADQLPEIIKTYTSQKDEYIALLDDAHANIPLDTWNKCIDTIIRGYLASKDTEDSADETERLHKSIKSLFFIAQRHLADKSWTQADVLSFLISRHNIELLASGVPAIKDLWDYCGEFFKPSLEISEQLKTLSSQYAHACLHFFTRLICYMTPLEHLNMSNLREALDAVFTPDETSFEGKIKCFISKLPNPPKVRESENAFDQLDTIIEHFETEMEKAKCLPFPDVQEALLSAKRSSCELRAFNAVINQIMISDEPQESPSDIWDEVDNLSRQITILQDDKQFSHSKLEERVEILFDRIQEEFTSPLTEEQLTTLHCFLTVCYEKMHIDPIKYRNILISYANNSSV